MVAKSDCDYATPDLFDGRVNERVRRTRAESVRSASKARAHAPWWFAVEVCEWCGVDRAGGCGACSDLKFVEK